MVSKVIAELLSWGKALLFAFVFSFIISMFLIQPYTVNGSSMEPTLDGLDPYDKSKVGDRVIVNKTSYIIGDGPRYGDIVIIDSRLNESRTIKNEILENPIIELFAKPDSGNRSKWIKRVIGVPGDQLTFKDGKIYRNGTMLLEDYIKEEMIPSTETIVVPNGHIFVMGDNRNHSLDSREIGAIPIDHVIGKVVFRFFPFDKINTF